MRKLNKRGDIPITILVIGIIAVCMLALFSFYFANRTTKNGLDSVGVIQKAAVMGDKIELYKNLGFTTEEIKKAFNLTGDYITFSQDGLSVKYNLP